MANTYTLFDLVWKCVVELGIARTGTATGGSTSTLVDTSGLRNVDEDYYEEGSLFILKSTDGAAPQKEFGEIDSFAADTDTVTLFSTVSAAIGAGDVYGVASRRFPLYLLKQKINNELYLGGEIPVDDTSLTTVADTLEYTLPEDIAAQDLRQVLRATSTDANNLRHVPVLNWDVQWSDTGTTSVLRLENELDAGYEMMLRYAKPHDELRSASDKLNVAIHPDRIVYQVCADSLRWYRNKTRLRHLDETVELLELKAQRARDRHPLPPLPTRQSKVTRVSRTLRMRGT
jgi:hypothetical protein